MMDASWGSFLQKLFYKAEYADKRVVRVDPRNTSKMCSRCGCIKESLGLEVRTYKCEQCGLEMDRDYNAAINIKVRGMELINSISKENRDIFSDTCPFGAKVKKPSALS